jgi:hypothetical protein
VASTDRGKELSLFNKFKLRKTQFLLIVFLFFYVLLYLFCNKKIITTSVINVGLYWSAIKIKNLISARGTMLAGLGGQGSAFG